MADKKVYIILYDRCWKANDNAEFLYRWIRDNHPEVKLAYILRKSAKAEWDRLTADKFNLLDLDNKAATEAEVRKCDYIASSIFNESVNLDFTGARCRRIFLNHGCFLVPINYIKKQKDNIDLFIAANKIEYDTMLHPYHGLRKDQVALCGQPRQDYLCKRQLAKHEEKNILIQMWQRPTKWTEADLKNSEFYKKLCAFINSPRIKTICEKHKVKFVFKMHSVNVNWLEYFPSNEYVRLSPTFESFEDVFVSSRLIITDISSNAYEMAKCGKPCIYFEPDHDMLFSWRWKKNGSWEFDLEKNSIGPIAYDVNSLFNELDKLLSNDCLLDAKYLDRRTQQISFVNSTKNCERVFNQIMALPIISEKHASGKSKFKTDSYLGLGGGYFGL